jgi:hypothetical protein
MAEGQGGIFDNPWVQGGSAALGAGADIYAWIDNQKRQAALKKIYDILANPGKLAQYINSYMQPMSRGAIDATNRDIGANWATQTGGAPGGALNQFTADAFAKIENQRYQSAAEQAIAALRGATGAGGILPTSPMGNLGSIMKILQQLQSSKPTTPKPTPQLPSAVPYPEPYNMNPLAPAREDIPTFTGGEF